MIPHRILDVIHGTSESRILSHSLVTRHPIGVIPHSKEYHFRTCSDISLLDQLSYLHVLCASCARSTILSTKLYSLQFLITVDWSSNSNHDSNQHEHIAKQRCSLGRPYLIKEHWFNGRSDLWRYCWCYQSIRNSMIEDLIDQIIYQPRSIILHVAREQLMLITSFDFVCCFAFSFCIS